MSTIARHSRLVMRKASAKPLPWRLIEHSRNVHEIHFSDVRAGFSHPILLSSDHHWDNPHCDRDLMRQHLEEALAAGAPVNIAGDFFCAMQGKWDKRASKDDIREEHRNGNYLDRLVDTAAEWLAPYAAVLAVISPGNHETAILKHHETNLSERLVEAIRHRCPSSPVRLGGYSGYVIYRFTIYKTQFERVHLWYHHGHGGGGPVTKGVIQTNRHAAYVEADIIHTGHIHEAWEFPVQRIRMTDHKTISHGEQLHISTPGYKEEYADGFGGFHIEGGRPPKPVGACWVNFTYQNPRIFFEARRAKPGVRLAPPPAR